MSDPEAGVGRVPLELEPFKTIAASRGDRWLMFTVGQVKELIAEVERLRALPSAPSVPQEALAQIVAERASQDRQWGGAAHDDSHQVYDWEAYIQRQLRGVVDCGESDLDGARGRFVKAAALALAAIESVDRRCGTPKAPR